MTLDAGPKVINGHGVLPGWEKIKFNSSGRYCSIVKEIYSDGKLAHVSIEQNGSPHATIKGQYDNGIKYTINYSKKWTNGRGPDDAWEKAKNLLFRFEVQLEYCQFEAIKDGYEYQFVSKDVKQQGRRRRRNQHRRR